METTAGLEKFHVVAGLASILWKPTISAQLTDVMKRLHTHLPPGWKTNWHQMIIALEETNGHQVAKEMYLQWMRRTKQRCLKCQTCMTAHCSQCGLPRCTQCHLGRCEGCNLETNSRCAHECQLLAQTKKRRRPDNQGCRIAREDMSEMPPETPPPPLRSGRVAKTVSSSVFRL